MKGMLTLVQVQTNNNLNRKKFHEKLSSNNVTHDSLYHTIIGDFFQNVKTNGNCESSYSDKKISSMHQSFMFKFQTNKNFEKEMFHTSFFSGFCDVIKVAII
jgi:hypothetical protein